MDPRWIGDAGRPCDTDEAAHERQTEAYRRMSGRERVAVSFRLNELARHAAEAGIRFRHTAYSEQQVRWALRRLWLGDELTRKAWPDRELVRPLTPEEEALGSLVRRLEDLQIPYMITGSVARSHHGRPRATHDIDVVIDATPSTLEPLVETLASSGFYVDAERALFNVIEDRTAVKIDLIIRKDRPFSVEELERRQSAELGVGLRVALATPEDTILSKLEWWHRSGGSEQQLADVAGILDVQGDRLDVVYIERWARELDLLDVWRTVAGRGSTS